MLTAANLARVARLLPDDFTAEEALIVTHAAHQLQNEQAAKPLPSLPPLQRPSRANLAAEAESLK